MIAWNWKSFIFIFFFIAVWLLHLQISDLVHIFKRLQMVCETKLRPMLKYNFLDSYLFCFVYKIFAVLYLRIRLFALLRKGNGTGVYAEISFSEFYNFFLFILFSFYFFFTFYLPTTFTHTHTHTHDPRPTPTTHDLYPRPTTHDI